MADWILQNTFLAGVLALVVALLQRFLRARPAVCHLLWLAVFAVLVTPPLPVQCGPLGSVRASLVGWMEPAVAAAPDVAEPARSVRWTTSMA